MTNATNVETKHLKVGDVSYAYRELRPAKLADPTPLVFLQRFRGTLDDWDPAFVDELAKTRHVILFSNAAVGSSTGTPAKDVDEKARNVASFARKLGYEQIDVLGFSMGGFDCQVIAIQEPKLVRKVIVIGSGPAGNAETAPPTDIVFGIALKETYAFEDIRYLFFAEGREQETRAYIERMGIRKDREPVVGAQVISAMVESVSAFMEGKTDHYSRLGELKQLVLIISGDRDPFLLSAEEHLVALSRACECAGSRVSARRPRTSPTAPHPGRGGGRALPFQEVIRSAGRTRQS
jgi:pimeloyl-ACP methyl ester carboxylesterase